ncbi:hypothetical protein Tco_0275417, partial [Tanacetum coccineum]
LREIEYFLNHDLTKEIDSILEDSVDEDNLADPNNDLVDAIPEMILLNLSPIMMMFMMIHLTPRKIKSKSLNS